MKKTHFIILLLFTLNSFSQNVTEAHLKYTLTLNIGDSANKELINSLYKDAENKEDSVMFENISKGLLEAATKINKLSSDTDIFIYPDSVCTKTIDSEIIFLPKKLKKKTILHKGEKIH